MEPTNRNLIGETDSIRPRGPSRISRCLSAIHRGFDYLFGLVTIFLALAILAAIPVVHFLSLGYFLEASARVARSGRVRDGFIGLTAAAWIGRVIVAGWLVSIPLRLFHSFLVDAKLVGAGSATVEVLRISLIVLVCLAGLGLLWGMIRGGRFRHYAWPAPGRFLRWLGEPKDVSPLLKWGRHVLDHGIWAWDFFKLGFLGFLGAVIWLALPVAILFGAGQIGNQGLSLVTSFLGALVLGFVALHLPFIQTRFAVKRDFSEFLHLRGARESFRKAPWALWVGLLVTILFSLPLYILKIELAPDEVAWLTNLIFVAFMFPARLILGWSTGHSLRRQTSRHWIFRGSSRLAMVPIVLVYVLVVWLAQYLSWHGSYSLFEQHAFLLPAPMLGL